MHERSVTIQNKAGRWVNVASVHKGKQLSSREAEAKFNRGELKALGGKSFGSVREAVEAAGKRSSRLLGPKKKKREAVLLRGE